MKYLRKQSANAVVQHHGIFRRQLSAWEVVALIISATIGAGVLGLPYVIAQVGIGIGLVMIVLLGGLMSDHVFGTGHSLDPVSVSETVLDVAVRTVRDRLESELARFLLVGQKA
jgi:hypothetical protein